MRLTKQVRWTVPTAVLLAVSAAVAIPAMSSAQPPELPPVTAGELLEDMLAAEPHALSGTVVHTADLGIPDLSGLSGMTGGESSGAGPIDLLDGSTTMKVWFDPEQGARASLLGAASEYSIVATPEDVWTYTSESNVATHMVLPEDVAESGDPSTEPSVPTVGSVDDMLAVAGEDAEIGVDPTVTVAGRDCYQLLVVPRDAETLIGSVRIAVDAETFTPLRFQVWATDDTATPAVETTFTDVSFQTPDPSVFDFVPPSGATTEEVTPEDVTGPEGDSTGSHTDADVPADGSHPDVEVIGGGWSAILAVTGVDPGMLTGNGTDTDGAPQDDAAFQDALATIGTEVDGGVAISTRLVSVLLTDDGRVFVGAVPVSVLQTAAA